MTISQLFIENFRNISNATIAPEAGLNLLFGANGSGKTSILEAIHFLGVGRSFRSHLSGRVIQTNTDKLTVFAALETSLQQEKIGFRRYRNGDTEAKVNGNKLKRLSQLAEIIPIQVITPESFSLLFEGPKARRQFIDWGAFHANDNFHLAWVNVRRILKQRNQLLRNGSDYQSIKYWDNELVHYAEQITAFRNTYVDSLNGQLRSIIEEFLPQLSVTVSFTQGWDNKIALAQLLESQYQRDLSLGHTVSGPHKADLRLRVGNMPVQDALSRGQLKLLVCAMRIAQGKLLKKQMNKNSIYLVDDLPSELDAKHRQLLLKQLTDTGAQVFVTAIEPTAILDSLLEPPRRMFEVKQGSITQVE